MDIVTLLGFGSALLIGILLGMIGGGGSILTLPVLVYLLDVDPMKATAYSLFVVGVSSFFGATEYMRKGLLSYKTALVFAAPSLVAVFATRHWLLPFLPENLVSIQGYDLTRDIAFALVLMGGVAWAAFVLLKKKLDLHNVSIGPILALMAPAAAAVFVMRQWVIPAIPEHLIEIGSLSITKSSAILLLFSVIMLLAAFAMLRPSKLEDAETANQPVNYTKIGLDGLLVGTVTGIVGAGGGFLIIPALVLLAKLPMRLAVGTSLLVITIKSLIGFTGDLGQQDIDWALLLPFTALAVVGIFGGSRLGGLVPAETLKKGFGWFTLGMGVFMILKETVFKC
jgi:uncharacterized membrane protein YfcA